MLKLVYAGFVCGRFSSWPNGSWCSNTDSVRSCSHATDRLLAARRTESTNSPPTLRQLSTNTSNFVEFGTSSGARIFKAPSCQLASSSRHWSLRRADFVLMWWSGLAYSYADRCRYVSAEANILEREVNNRYLFSAWAMWQAAGTSKSVAAFPLCAETH